MHTLEYINLYAAVINEVPLRLPYYVFQVALWSPFTIRLACYNLTICSSLISSIECYLLSFNGLLFNSFTVYHAKVCAVNIYLRSYKWQNICTCKTLYFYSTVTLFARFLGLSTSRPLATLT